jgi:hypothetical protein
MLLYSLTKIYDRYTGKEDCSILKATGGKLCDYTGEVIDGETLADGPLLYTVKIDYDYSSEPNWYYDDARGELENMGVSYENFARFIYGPYHFMVNYDTGGYGDNSMRLVKEWLDIHNREDDAAMDDPLYQAGTIDKAFRVARYRTLFRLLKEGKYNLVDFGMPPETTQLR